jgi:glycosyltransferase involved in cell wall biosynthesis
MTSRSLPNSEVDITIFVSCYNEEDLITDTLQHVSEALRAANQTYEIIVVDDVSRDGSAERVRKYISDHPEEPISLVVNKINRGLANNYVEAAFMGKGKYYRLCCGDDSEPVEAMTRLFRQVGRADIIVAYQDQDLVEGKGANRRLISKTFTFLVNLISGYSLKYYNGSSIHLRYNVMRWHPSSYGFGFQADILTRLLDEGASYIQVQSSGNDRKGSGSSALNMRNFLSVGHTLLELSIRRLRRALYGSSMSKPREVFDNDKLA